MAPTATETATVERARRLVEARLPTDHGDFRIRLYANDHDGKDHVALVAGDVDEAGARECLTGDVFHSRRCDCGEQLRLAMKRVAARKLGVILLLKQEGRGIGLLDKLRAYNLQDLGHDTVDANLRLGRGADERDYTAAALILAEMHITRVQLLTNNPAKVESLRSLGISDVERVSLEASGLYQDNFEYLRTKVVRMNHAITNLADYARRHGYNAEVFQRALSDADEAPIVDDQADGRTSASPSATPAVAPLTKAASSSPAPGTAVVVAHGEAAAMAADIGPFRPAGQLRPGRPFITVTYAQTLNGCIARRDNERLQLSGPESTILTHRLRARHYAILVGIATVLSDDPRLTVRLPGNSNHQCERENQPRAVVLDASLRTPPSAALFGRFRSSTGPGKDAARPIIYCARDAEERFAERAAALREAGAVLVPVAAESSSGHLDVAQVVGDLATNRAVENVMVEGGAAVIGAFLGAGLVDRVVITVVPRFVANGKCVVQVPDTLLASGTTHVFGKDTVIAATL